MPAIGDRSLGGFALFNFKNTQCDTTQALGLILCLNFEIMEDFAERKRKEM
jgi:hypothetical protein